MDKETLFNRVLEVLPDNFKNGYLVFKKECMPFTEFLKNEFINYFSSTTNVSEVIDKINYNFTNRVFPLEVLKLRKIEKFISTDVEDSLKDEFKFEAINRINNDLMFNIGENVYDINEFYQVFKKNHEEVYYTNEEIEEILNNYLNAYLEPELQDFVLPEYHMSAREFVMGVLRESIDEKGELQFDLDPNEYEDNSIENAVMMIASYTKEKALKEMQKKEEELNHTSDNPSLVPEINAILNKDNKLEVTSEIPVFVSPLTDMELNSLSTEVNVEELIVDLIEDIKEYLYYCSNGDMIKWVSSELAFLVDLINSTNNQETYEHNIMHVLNKLEEIKRNLIRVEANKSDYVDAIFGEISNSQNDVDLIKINDEVEKKNIKDNQLKGRLAREIRENAKKNILADYKKLNLERFFIDAEIEFRIIEIKKLKKNLEALNASNNYIAGTEIKYRQAISDFEKLINEVDISEEDKTTYIEIINGIIDQNENGMGRV